MRPFTCGVLYNALVKNHSEFTAKSEVNAQMVDLYLTAKSQSFFVS